ncbi:MAG: hypothetical protein U0736_14055 [Gemmataceae bacterium]
MSSTLQRQRAADSASEYRGFRLLTHDGWHYAIPPQLGNVDLRDWRTLRATRRCSPPSRERRSRC